MTPGQHFRIAMLTWLAFALAFLALCAFGQMPSLSNNATIYYYALAATNGLDRSTWSNEVIWTNRAQNFTWKASTSSDVTGYLLGIGKASGQYTRFVGVGSGTNWAWPPAPPSIVAFAYGGHEFFRATNPPGTLFFRAYPATNSTWVSISDSSDLRNWNSAYALVNTTGDDLTITRTP